MRAIREDEHQAGPVPCDFCQQTSSGRTPANWRNENTDPQAACGAHKHLLKDGPTPPHTVRRRMFLGRSWGFNNRASRNH